MIEGSGSGSVPCTNICTNPMDPDPTLDPNPQDCLQGLRLLIPFSLRHSLSMHYGTKIRRLCFFVVTENLKWLHRHPPPPPSVIVIRHSHNVYLLSLSLHLFMWQVEASTIVSRGRWGTSNDKKRRALFHFIFTFVSGKYCSCEPGHSVLVAPGTTLQAKHSIPVS
jgi:hypothetical protein